MPFAWWTHGWLNWFVNCCSPSSGRLSGSLPFDTFESSSSFFWSVWVGGSNLFGLKHLMINCFGFYRSLMTIIFDYQKWFLIAFNCLSYQKWFRIKTLTIVVVRMRITAWLRLFAQVRSERVVSDRRKMERIREIKNAEIDGNKSESDELFTLHGHSLGRHRKTLN